MPVGIDFGRLLHRRWQFSLRSLLLATTLVALVCAWYLHERAKIAAKHAAIRAIGNRGVFVIDPRGHWLHKLLGDEQPGDIAWVHLQHADLETPLVALQKVKQRTPLEVHINLYHSLTPAEWRDLHACPHRLNLRMDTLHDVPELIRCRNLYGLDPGGMNVTDVDLEEVKQLKQLRYLDLSHTDVTDRGLDQLGELQNLQHLALGDCPRVTRQGLATLEQLPNLEVLEIGGSSVGTSWISRLKRLPKLRRLVLYETLLSRDDVTEFLSQSQWVVEFSNPSLSP
jgi:Leucine-rich repeat (LRR) protein